MLTWEGGKLDLTSEMSDWMIFIHASAMPRVYYQGLHEK